MHMGSKQERYDYHVSNKAAYENVPLYALLPAHDLRKTICRAPIAQCYL